MPWNSPGGNNDKDKDPWGQNSGNQGPPDLEDVFRNLTKKFGGIFGSGGGSSAGSSGSGKPILLFALVAAIAIWGIYDRFGFYIVKQAERGVELRFGEFKQMTSAGLNWKLPFPIETVEIVNVDEVREVSNTTSMLTQDENIVSVSLEAQYKIGDAEKYIFNVRDPDVSVKSAMESALREIVGKSKIDFVLFEGREQISIITRELLQEILDNFESGIFIQKVNMEKSLPPDQVKEAFDDAIKSREDFERYIQEAEAYANSILPQARGEAARFLQEADAYRDRAIANSEGEAKRFLKLLAEYEKAPEVTRERLYLESVESVFNNTNKVMIDVEGGNNIMYLPLDQIVKQRSMSNNQSSTNETFSTENFGLSTQQAGSGRPEREGR